MRKKYNLHVFIFVNLKTTYVLDVVEQVIKFVIGQSLDQKKGIKSYKH